MDSKSDILSPGSPQIPLLGGDLAGNRWGGKLHSISKRLHNSVKDKVIEKRSRPNKLRKTLSEQLAPHCKELERVRQTSCEDLTVSPESGSILSTEEGAGVDGDRRHARAASCEGFGEISTELVTTKVSFDLDLPPRKPCGELPSASNQKTKSAPSHSQEILIAPPPLPPNAEAGPSKPKQHVKPQKLKKQDTLPDKPVPRPIKAKENAVIIAPLPPPPKTAHDSKYQPPPPVAGPSNHIPPPLASQSNGSKGGPRPLGMTGRTRTCASGTDPPPYSQSQTLPTKRRGFKTPFAKAGVGPSPSPEIPILDQNVIVRATTTVSSGTITMTKALRRNGSAKNNIAYPQHVPYIPPVRDPYSPATSTAVSSTGDGEIDETTSPDADSSFGEVDFPMDPQALDELMREYD